MTSRIVYSSRGTRQTRRMSRLSITAVGVIIIAVFTIGAWVAVARLPSLQVHDIAISGLQTVDEDAVRAHMLGEISGNRLLFLPHASYFLADTGALAENLRAAFPAIAEVRIKKIFPRSLAAVVTERTFWGIMCAMRPETASPQCVALDTTGYGYAPAPRPQGNLILMVGTDRAELTAGKQHIEPKLMERLTALHEGIRQAGGLEVSRFELKERVPDEIRVGVTDGFMIYFRRDDDFANTFRVIKKVLDTEIGDRRAELDYLDARFGNKVFYKMK